MKNFNTREYNVLCAKFLGAEITQAYSVNKDLDQDGLHIQFPKDVSLGLYKNYSTYGLKFDSDWNWIMEVVDKIEDIVMVNEYQTTVSVIIDGVGCEISYSDFKKVTLADVIKKTKKEATIYAIWDFLNWYYENNVGETHSL